MFGYINGNVVPEEEMRINPRDLGILRGYAVFDVMPVFNGEPFLSEGHWKRFVRSGDILGLKPPLSFEEWESKIKELLDKNSLNNASVRTVLTGGVSKNHSAFKPNYSEVTIYILMDSWSALPLEWYQKGISVITKSYVREFCEAKTVDYIFPISQLKEKEERGAEEIIYISDGNILEASTANICVVSQGKILSPKENVLGGITRGFVLSLAKKLGFPVEEREVSVSEMMCSEEMFLTGSYKNILPVTRVDENIIGDGTVGKITKELALNFWEKIGMKPNPFSER